MNSDSVKLIWLGVAGRTASISLTAAIEKNGAQPTRNILLEQVWHAHAVGC